jgi:tetraacyldisaccharide 4'-kinase
LRIDKLSLIIQRWIRRPPLLWILLTFPFQLIFWLAYLFRKITRRPVDHPGAICIGNIAIGGSGKTPFLIQLAKDLQAVDPVIVSKGYLRKKRGDRPVTVQSDPLIVGDEPLMIKKSLPGTRVWVVDDRLKWIRQQQPGCYLFDDGMQDFRFQAGVSIGLCDRQIFSGAYLLPTGILREPRQALQSCDAIGIKGKFQEDEWEKILTIMAKDKIHAPVFNFDLIPAQYVGVNTSQSIDREIPTALFCALGNPQSFIDSVRATSCSIHKIDMMADHRTYSPDQWVNQLKTWEKEGIKQVVMTKKDAVKLKNVEELPLPVFTLETTVAVLRGQKVYHALIQDILKRLKKTNQSVRHGKK